MMNLGMGPAGFAALAIMVGAGSTTTALAAPGDGPREVRPTMLGQQWALPEAMTATTTVTQALNIAQSATQGVATAVAVESHPDGQVVVIDIVKDGMRRKVVVNRDSAKIEQAALDDHGRTSQPIE